jgi:hypothetical protein
MSTDSLSNNFSFQLEQCGPFLYLIRRSGQGDSACTQAPDTLQSNASTLSQRQTSHTVLSWVKTQAITSWHKSKYKWIIRVEPFETSGHTLPEFHIVYLINILFSLLYLTFFHYGYKTLGLYELKNNIYRKEEKIETPLIQVLWQFKVFLWITCRERSC